MKKKRYYFKMYVLKLWCYEEKEKLFQNVCYKFFE